MTPSSPPPSSHPSSVRAQAAFVRTLMDEIARLAPSDPLRALALREQLEDERARLERLADPPRPAHVVQDRAGVAPDAAPRGTA